MRRKEEDGKRETKGALERVKSRVERRANAKRNRALR